MPSIGKTKKLFLNQWVEADIPKMADFNADNLLVDSACKTHFEDGALHLSPADRALLSAPFLCGSYVGTGALSRTVTLGFNPSFGVVFAESSFLCEFDSDISTSICGLGFLTPHGCSLGMSTAENGFAVKNADGASTALSTPVLNRANVTYCYIMWK